MDSLATHYSPVQERPLRAYALLAGTFATGVGGSLLALRRSGRELSERPSAADVLLVGVASHKLSRLIAKDKVTSFVRAPFTRFEDATGQGEVAEQPCGHGLGLAIGELLICPYCLSQWIAAGMTIGLVGAPRMTRFAGSILAAHTISDFLQLAYHAAEQL